MHRSRWLLLMVVFGSGLASPVQALDPKPERRSHFLPDDFTPTDNLEQSLLERLRRAQNLRDTHSLVQKLVNNQDLLKKFNLKPQDIDRLRRLAPNNPELINDPRWRQQLLEALDQPNRMSPEQMELFRKLAERYIQRPGAFPPLPHDMIQPPIWNPPALPRQSGPTPALPPRPAQAPPMSERWKEFLSKHLDRLADGLQELDSSNDSQTLRDAIRQLNRLGVGEGQLNLDRLTPGQLETLESVARWLSPESIGSVDWAALTRRDWIAGLPRMTLPRVTMPVFSPSPWPGLPSTPSMPGVPSGNVWVWVVLLVLLGVLVWKWNVLFRPGQEEGEAWRLGPWPVAPDRVTTRGELVRAFEYLALLLLGPAARTQNHHDLAQQMDQASPPSNGGPAGHTVVEHLAQLYEQARYAPEQADANVPLSQHEQAFARRALCLLAGLNPE